MHPRSAVIALALVVAPPAGAQVYDPHTYEPSLVLRLPPYCKYTMFFNAKVPGGDNRVEQERWKNLMGPTFIHMHHYCYGLMATNRAIYLSPTREARNHNFGISIQEYDYVIQRAPEGFGLLPEMLTRKGESLISLDRGPEGVGELRRAIDIQPDYWPAYAAASDYYKEHGAPSKAREWLEKGLAAAPDTRALTRRLDALNISQGKGSRAKNQQPRAER
jgi:tetratricopeptide (TPR) repeat protein